MVLSVICMKKMVKCVKKCFNFSDKFLEIIVLFDKFNIKLVVKKVFKKYRNCYVLVDWFFLRFMWKFFKGYNLLYFN